MKKQEEEEAPGYEGDEEPGSALKKGKKKTKKTKMKMKTKKKSDHEIPPFKGRKSKRISKTKKYKSIRNLFETMFAVDPNVEDETLYYEVAREYPESKMITEQKYHFALYRTRIVSYKDFRTMEPPDWAK